MHNKGTTFIHARLNMLMHDNAIKIIIRLICMAKHDHQQNHNLNHHNKLCARIRSTDNSFLGICNKYDVPYEISI